MKLIVKYRWVCCAAGILLLVVYSKNITDFAAAGVEVCLHSVIPSLFPLIYLSSVLAGILSSYKATEVRVISRIFKVPQGSEFLVLLGFLCGYPVGAQNVSNAYQAGLIKKGDAKRMLILCNNAGPSFIFGIVAQQFNDSAIGWVLWAILIFSSWVTSIIIMRTEYSPLLTGVQQQKSPQALTTSIKSVATICGWVILFRVFLGIADIWFLKHLPTKGRIFFSGLVELTNGCVKLGNISNSFERFMIATVLLSIGGICVFMQTATVVGDLGIKGYFQGKLLHSSISCILCYVAQPALFPGALEVKHIAIAIAALVIAVCNIVYFVHNKELSRFLKKDIVYC